MDCWTILTSSSSIPPIRNVQLALGFPLSHWFDEPGSLSPMQRARQWLWPAVLTLSSCVFLAEEAALVLGRDTELLTQIMDWCETKEHGGVRGEASRLLAALIRHSRSPVGSSTPPETRSVLLLIKPLRSCCLIATKQEVVGAVAKAGGVQHLISMATSEHVIMQNEALVALAIASAVDVGNFPALLPLFLFVWPTLTPHIICLDLL